jgi:hypothetical protein
MPTATETLTQRYDLIISAFLNGIATHRLVLPAWLATVFNRMFKSTHLKARALLQKLIAGTYRLPRARTTPRPPRPPAPPVDAPPAYVPPDPPPITGWMWLARILPTEMAPAAATCRAELQQLLSEPAMQELFTAAPALRRHLRPFCRALGVTLPGDPTPPPDPEPAPMPPDPPPEIGFFVHGRDPTPPWFRMPRILPQKRAF